MPAAAVIPAPRVYICVAAVEKLVVGVLRCFWVVLVVWDSVPAPVKHTHPRVATPRHFFRSSGVSLLTSTVERVTLSKSECSKQTSFSRLESCSME